MDLAQASDRLAKLVRDNVGGELRQFEAVEHMPHETAFIVRWCAVPDKKYGVHRAVLANNRDEGMLVWGDYYDGTFSAPRSLRGYHDRVNWNKERTA